MLVLTRSPGQSIVIDDGIVIRVRKILRGRLRLSVRTDRQVEVTREIEDGVVLGITLNPGQHVDFIRDAGSSFTVGESIAVHVESIKGTRTRIGVDAPRHLAVFRGEVQAAREAISRLNAAA